MKEGEKEDTKIFPILHEADDAFKVGKEVREGRKEVREGRK